MNIEIYRKKNDEWYGLMMGLSLLAIGLSMMGLIFIVGTKAGAALVFGFFIFLAGLAITLLFYRMFSVKKPFVEIQEDFILVRTATTTDMKEFVDHLINYSDIKSITIEGSSRKAPDIIEMKISGKNNDTVVTFGDNEITNENVRLETDKLEFEKNKFLRILEMKQSAPNQGLSAILSSIEYWPNTIPFYKRVIYFFLATFITIYVGYSISIGRLIIPTEDGALVLYGSSLWIASIAFLCCVTYFIIKIFDHYDKRDNEKMYWQYSNFVFRTGVSLYFLALIVRLFS